MLGTLIAANWNPVVIAIATSIPGAVAAGISYVNRQHLRTRANGATMTLGQQVDEITASVAHFDARLDHVERTLAQLTKNTTPHPRRRAR